MSSLECVKMTIAHNAASAECCLFSVILCESFIVSYFLPTFGWHTSFYNLS
jgi:hypothetical protein